MMKIGALLAAMLLLVSVPFAQSYTKTYVSDGWLEITRVVSVGAGGDCPLAQAGVSDVCANSGSTQPGKAGGAATKVTLVVRNVGAQDRDNVNLGESLSYVPLGAGITFSPSPSQFDGRQAVWEIAQLSRGDSRNFSYEFTSTVSEAAVARIPDAAALSAPTTVALYAPSRLPVNSTLTLSLKASDGKPISGARILVGYPDGSRQAVKTDASGTASITAGREGSYTYSVDGYHLSQVVSTIAYDAEKEKAATIPAAASAADAGLLPGIIGALPLLAGIFAVAVVMLIIYNFLAARREDEDASGPAPQLAEEQAKGEAGMNYTQKFSFGAEEGKQKDLDDKTRRMVESRKRRMEEAAPAEQEDKPARREEANDYSDSEKTLAGSEMDEEIAELEKNARIAGEVAQQEKEVENMLAQLEEIRNRLRAGRSAPGDAEMEQPERPVRKPAAPSSAKPRQSSTARAVGEQSSRSSTQKQKVQPKRRK